MGNNCLNYVSLDIILHTFNHKWWLICNCISTVFSPISYVYIGLLRPTARTNEPYLKYFFTSHTLVIPPIKVSISIVFSEIMTHKQSYNGILKNSKQLNQDLSKHHLSFKWISLKGTQKSFPITTQGKWHTNGTVTLWFNPSLPDPVWVWLHVYIVLPCAALGHQAAF